MSRPQERYMTFEDKTPLYTDRIKTLYDLIREQIKRENSISYLSMKDLLKCKSEEYRLKEFKRNYKELLDFINSNYKKNKLIYLLYDIISICIKEYERGFDKGNALGYEEGYKTGKSNGYHDGYLSAYYELDED